MSDREKSTPGISIVLIGAFGVMGLVLLFNRDSIKITGSMVGLAFLLAVVLGMMRTRNVHRKTKDGGLIAVAVLALALFFWAFVFSLDEG